MSDLAVIRSNLDSIREIDARGVESWSARSLSPLLGYSRFEKFMPVLERTQEDLAMQGYLTDTHIHRTVQMIEAGNGAERDIGDWKLSRLACYLTCMNARTPEGSLARQYFAFQARRAEMADQQAQQAVGHPALAFHREVLSLAERISATAGQEAAAVYVKTALGQQVAEAARRSDGPSRKLRHKEPPVPQKTKGQQILEAIHEAGRPVRPCEVARITGIPAHQVRPYIARLVEAGKVACTDRGYTPALNLN